MAKRIAAANGASKDRHFLQACRELLEFPIVSVDVGADGGVREWGELATLCVVHAFEPRQNSFAELQRSLTESRQQYLKIHNIGLARTTGRHRLYVTRIPQASSLIKPKPASLLLKRWRQDNGFDVTQELEVDCISLAQFVQEENLSRIDFLKLDTQGSELDILRGGGDFLREISIIKCEVMFVQLYEGQPLFDEVVGTLASYGFRFFAFDGGGGEVYGKKIWSDCMFVQSKFTDHGRLMRAAAILIHFGYYEEALWLLVDHGVPVEMYQRLANARIEDITPARAKLWKAFRGSVRRLLKAIGVLQVARKLLNSTV
jgi:FkbM family methyltransferase